MIDRQRSWTDRAAVQWETAAWVHCSNTERLHSVIGYRPMAEFEDHFRHTAPARTSRWPEPSVRQIQVGSDQYLVAGASSGAPSPEGSVGQVCWYGRSPANWSHS